MVDVYVSASGEKLTGPEALCLARQRGMLGNPYIEPDSTQKFLEAVREAKESYECVFDDVNLLVFPGVLSPAHEWGTLVHVQWMPSAKGKCVLDVGTGTGAIAVACHKQGATQVDAVDINPQCVKNAKENFKRNSMKQARVFLSNLFEHVTGLYDIIHFNPPYHGYIPADELEMSVTDHQYTTLRKFLFDAKQFLNKDGVICLQFSDLGDIELLQKLVEENEYEIKQFYAESRDWSTFLYILGLRC